VLAALVEGFRSEGVEYALIGGFALGLWGVQRATVDLDFLIHRDRLPAVDRLIESYFALFGRVDLYRQLREDQRA